MLSRRHFLLLPGQNENLKIYFEFARKAPYLPDMASLPYGQTCDFLSHSTGQNLESLKIVSCIKKAPHLEVLFCTIRLQLRYHVPHLSPHLWYALHRLSMLLKFYADALQRVSSLWLLALHDVQPSPNLQLLNECYDLVYQFRYGRHLQPDQLHRLPPLLETRDQWKDLMNRPRNDHR